MVRMRTYSNPAGGVHWYLVRGLGSCTCRMRIMEIDLLGNTHIE